MRWQKGNNGGRRGLDLLVHVGVILSKLFDIVALLTEYETLLQEKV